MVNLTDSLLQEINPHPAFKDVAVVATHDTTLLNGVRVVVHVVPGAPNVDLAVGVRAGSLCEEAGVDPPGVAHFLEHMVFKGSRTADGKTFGPRDIERNVFNGSGESDAGVKPSHAMYWSFVPKEKAVEGLTGLASALCRPDLEPTLIAAEKKIVQNEWLKQRLHPSNIGDERAQKGVHAVFGTMSSLEAMDRSAIKSFHDAFYTNDRMVVLVTGDVVPHEIFQCVDKEFTRSASPVDPALSRERRFPDVPSGEPPRGTRVDLSFLTDGMSEASVRALANVLTKGQFGVLRQILRDEAGLIYRVDCARDAENKTMTFSFASFFDDVLPCCRGVVDALGRVEEGLDPTFVRLCCAPDVVVPDDLKKVAGFLKHNLSSVSFTGDAGSVPSEKDVRALFAADSGGFVRPSAKAATSSRSLRL